MYCNIQYTYSVENVSYNGSHANIWSAIASVRFCKFVQLRQELEPISCFYNPVLPTESILDRRLRPKSLFVSVFVTISLGYAVFTILLFDGTLGLMPGLVIHIFSLGTAVSVILFCMKVAKMVGNSLPVEIALAFSLFFCLTLTFWFIRLDLSIPNSDFDFESID